MKGVIVSLEHIETKASGIRKYLKNNDNVDMDLLDKNIDLLFKEFKGLYFILNEYKKGNLVDDENGRTHKVNKESGD